MEYQCQGAETVTIEASGRRGAIFATEAKEGDELPQHIRQAGRRLPLLDVRPAEQVNPKLQNKIFLHNSLPNNLHKLSQPQIQKRTITNQKQF